MKHFFRAALVAAVVILPATPSAHPNAAAQNAAQTESMVVALRRSLGSGAEIHASGYSLTPDFSSGRRRATGSNTVAITTAGLADLGKAIDAATRPAPARTPWPPRRA